jgi:hypothetical protein
MTVKVGGLCADYRGMQDAVRTASMQLVAQDFGNILATLKAAEETKGHERRTTTRMDVQAQVKVVPIKDGKPAEPFTCMTRDLSFKGIGLLQSRQSARGSQFVITLPKKDGESASILCMVLYCRVLADGIYNVGAEFLRPYDFNAPPTVEFRRDGAPSGAGRGGEGELDRIRQSILG